MARKRIRYLSVRLTTADDLALHRLARAAGCSESELVRSLILTAARELGLVDVDHDAPASKPIGKLLAVGGSIT